VECEPQMAQIYADEMQWIFSVYLSVAGIRPL